MNRPKCYGTYQENEEVCEGCKWVDPCEIESVKAKKEKKGESEAQSGFLTEADQDLLNSLNMMIDDPLARLIKLRREALDTNDMALAIVLNRAIAQHVKTMSDDKGKTTSLEEKLLEVTVENMTKDHVTDAINLFEVMSNLVGPGGRSDTEAVADAIKEVGVQGMETAKDIFGRRRLPEKAKQEALEQLGPEDFARCPVCEQVIPVPNPVSCPHCGATEENIVEMMQKAGKKVPPEIRKLHEALKKKREEAQAAAEEQMEMGELPECFGHYDPTDDECRKCADAQPCAAETEAAPDRELPPKSIFKKKAASQTPSGPDYMNQPLPDGAHDLLDDVHRLCEWVVGDVDAITNTTTMYKIGIGSRLKLGRQPREKDLKVLKWSLFTSEIGLPKLMELAAQYQRHPEAEDYQIPEIIDVLSSPQGKGFINASWGQLKKLTRRDKIGLTDKDRMDMVQQVNAYSPLVKLDPKDYIKSKAPSKKPEKKKPRKKIPDNQCPFCGKKLKSKAGRDTHIRLMREQGDEKHIKEQSETKKAGFTTCPMCGKELLIEDLSDHMDAAHPKAK